eukprot:CAMPEP_0203792836 /NCGR_PEP_ID=MMETSP0100_2-20121128/5497_1 /ASSEMBLY_ACC=CAM_ASM_000210 /TAXON_ID=96639 /ORGANISM=" , Strain NY0313808BC1" /LENGTH=435 /DNA_ID=CAMNT_0050696481 /DNA_START=939 /DNA_END=2243 /DNA_ORIENTATION=+
MIKLVSFVSLVYGACGLFANRFGTKTPYSMRSVLSDHHEDAQCMQGRAIHIYQLTRHGTRFPTEKHMKKLNGLRNLFSEHDQTGYWDTYTYELRDAGLLAKAGETELFELGKRVRARFPELFTKEYHPMRYDFHSSQVLRVLQSASAFSHGIFLDAFHELPFPSVAITSDTKSEDRRLRFHKACPAYVEKVKKNKTLHEKGPHAALETTVYTEVFESILKKLEGKNQLVEALREHSAESIVSRVWSSCMMEFAVRNVTNSFCKLLSSRDVELLEHLDDVSTYWLKSYGFSINYNMSCLLFLDMLSSLESKALDPDASDRLATFRFGHAESLIPFIARLGLFRDADISGIFTDESNIEHLHVQERKWRVSSISPFAANVAAVLYASENGLFVRIFHNELPVRLSDTLCPPDSRLHDDTACDFEGFKDAASRFVCNF